MRHMDMNGADMIPIRLVLSITIIATIVVLFVVGFGRIGVYLAEHQVEAECQMLESTLSTMIASGVPRDVDDINAADGTKRVQTFSLPDSLLYLSFGGDPDPYDTGMLTSKLIEDGSAIFYRVQGGSKQVIWLGEDFYKFRKGEYINNKWIINGLGHSHVISGGGKTTLVFEYVQQSHIQYILIYSN